MSLKKIILGYLEKEYPRVVHQGEIERKTLMEWGYEASNASRRCRELRESGLVERIENEKGEVMYQFKTKKILNFNGQELEQINRLGSNIR